MSFYFCIVANGHGVILTCHAAGGRRLESPNEYKLKERIKTAFCLGEKQGMLANDECSSWYNRVGDFLV